MDGKNWEAFIRALRTFVQGLIATGLIAAYDAVMAALNNGDGLDPKKLGAAALAAFVASVVAYIMNVIAPRKPTP